MRRQPVSGAQERRMTRHATEVDHCRFATIRTRPFRSAQIGPSQVLTLLACTVLPRLVMGQVFCSCPGQPMCSTATVELRNEATPHTWIVWGGSSTIPVQTIHANHFFSPMLITHVCIGLAPPGSNIGIVHIYLHNPSTGFPGGLLHS